jgi:hypothetical protein
MTKLGKCLVVLAVGVAFAFLGFAWVSMMGGPNWEAEAAALPNYAFQKSEGPAPKWSVKEADTGENVNVPAVGTQAAAVIAARRHLQQKQQAEIDRLQKETESYKQKLGQVRAMNETDVKALAARVEELVGQLAALNDKILSLSNEVVKRSQEAQALRTEVTKRREDVFRLTRELDEIRGDQFRADELQKKLHDQLTRLEGTLATLEERNGQLRRQVGVASRQLPDPAAQTSQIDSAPKRPRAAGSP